MFLKGEKLGAEIQASTLYRVEKGDFVYSRLFAWKGSFAIASSSDDGCFVSNEFPCFHPDLKRLDPEFLRYYFSQQHVWLEALGLSSGSTPTSRNRLKESQLLSMRISLPPLEEQRRIVARVEALAARIEEARGLRKDTLERVKTFSQRLRQTGASSEFDLVPLRKYVQRLENGWSPNCESRPVTGGDEWGVLKVGAVSFGAFNENQNKALPMTLTPRPEYEVKAGDFLMSRANTVQLVGACAVVHATRTRLMLSDKIFRFVFRPDKPINLEFLNILLKSSDLRRQIEEAASGTSPTMKNISKEKVLELLIPDLDLNLQDALVETWKSHEAKISQLERLQTSTRLELDALLPSVLAKAFAGEL